MNILDVFFPRLCALCDTEGTFLCERCVESLTRWPTGVCAWCSAGGTSNICRRCAGMIGLDELWIGYRYDDKQVARIVHLLKYNNRETLGVEIGTILGMNIVDVLTEIDVIVPIPLDTVRHKERGFNQSFCIARGIVKASRKGRVCTDFLSRTISRAPQATLGASARWENMTGVYRVNLDREIPKKVLLVDDVTTTGATLRSAISVLREAGVEKVSALVFAHGTPPVVH